MAYLLQSVSQALSPSSKDIYQCIVQSAEQVIGCQKVPRKEETAGKSVSDPAHWSSHSIHAPSLWEIEPLHLYPGNALTVCVPPPSSPNPPYSQILPQTPGCVSVSVLIIRLTMVPGMFTTALIICVMRLPADTAVLNVLMNPLGADRFRIFEVSSL